MASGSVTTTGLREMRAGIDQLPKRVTEALRAVAWRTSRRVKEGAQRRLRSLTHGTGRTANAIVVIEEADAKQFVVASQGDASKPAMLPVWLEYGTVKMSARPYMRPAALAESDQYKREMESASIAAAREAFGD